MSTDAKSLLLEAINDPKNTQTFYICGKDYRCYLEIQSKAREAALHSGAGDFNYLEIDAREIVYASKLTDSLNTLPILAPRSVIVVHCADKLSGHARAALSFYLNQKMEKCVLLLLFNTPHTQRDEELAQDERITLVVCD